METWVHSLFSLILAAILYPFFGWGALFVFIGGVMIDFDHYIWYVYNLRKYNPFKCYTYFIKDIGKNNWQDVQGTVLVFHTVEFLALCIILSFFNTIALLFTIGLIGHYLLDFIWYLRVPKRAILDHSLIHWYANHHFNAFRKV